MGSEWRNIKFGASERRVTIRGGHQEFYFIPIMVCKYCNQPKLWSLCKHLWLVGYRFLVQFFVGLLSGICHRWIRRRTDVVLGNIYSPTEKRRRMHLSNKTLQSGSKRSDSGDVYPKSVFVKRRCIGRRTDVDAAWKQTSNRRENVYRKLMSENFLVNEKNVILWKMTILLIGYLGHRNIQKI